MIQLAQTYSDSQAASGLAAFMLVFFAFFAIAGGLWWWAFISAATKPAEVWKRAEQNKTLWMVLIFGIGIIGAIGYLISVRPKLLAWQETMLSPAPPPLPAPPVDPIDYATLGR